MREPAAIAQRRDARGRGAYASFLSRRTQRESAGSPVDELCEIILERVAEFRAGTPQQDDMTLVVARVR